MDAHWIVAANAGRARFFSQPDADAAYEEMNEMINAGARAKAADTESDELGRRSAATSSPRSGTPAQGSDGEPRVTPTEHQRLLFAASIAEFLLRQHQAERFRRLTLAASPEFLGVLRKALDPGLKAIVDLQIDRDYTQSTGPALREHVKQHRLPS